GRRGGARGRPGGAGESRRPGRDVRLARTARTAKGMVTAVRAGGSGGRGGTAALPRFLCGAGGSGAEGGGRGRGGDAAVGGGVRGGVGREGMAPGVLAPECPEIAAAAVVGAVAEALVGRLTPPVGDDGSARTTGDHAVTDTDVVTEIQLFCRRAIGA